MPLATTLVSGDLQIHPYDSAGHEQEAVTQRFVKLDLDVQASSFLEALDGLLAPDLAAAISKVDRSSYDTLVTAREDLAHAISSRIAPVFTGQTGMGDLRAAQVRFRERLLASLATGFSTSTIVQVPATVSVTGPGPSGGSSLPPDLECRVTGARDAAGTDTFDRYTFSAAVLPTEASSSYLTFLVSVVHPTADAGLCLDLSCSVGPGGLRVAGSEKRPGHAPSGRLGAADPDTGRGEPPLVVSDATLGKVDIPIPRRRYPVAPWLVRQTYVSTHGAPVTIAEALERTYEVKVSRPTAAEDDLHLSIAFNEAPTGSAALVRQGGNLFDALVRFRVQYPRIDLTAITEHQATARQWVHDLVELVQGVTSAWPPEAGHGNAAVGPDTSGGEVPASNPWEFMLQVRHQDEPNRLLLTWNGSVEPRDQVWPKIENVTGTPTTQPIAREYTLPSSATFTELRLSWEALPVVTIRSASTLALIVRNENLTGCGIGAADRRTNQDFVSRTSTVSFAVTTMPTLEVSQRITVREDSVREAVESVLEQITQPPGVGGPVTTVPVVIGVDYASVPASGSPGHRMRRPVLSDEREGITAADPPQPGCRTVTQLTDTLEKELVAWHDDARPSDNDASLIFELTVFATEAGQALVRLNDIETTISGPGWWKSSS